MVIEFNRSLFAQVRKFNGDSKEERCGLLFQREFPEHSMLFEVPTISQHPRSHFAIAKSHASTLLGAHGIENLIGVFHTHVRKEDVLPSPHDMAMLGKMCERWPRLVGIVYNVPMGLLVEYSAMGPMRQTLISEREAVT